MTPAMRASCRLIVGDNYLGKAVFAAVPIQRGSLITEFRGPRIHRSQVPDDRAGAADRFMQIDREHYLGPSGGVDDLINHSCDPNAGLKFGPGVVHLIAIRDIGVGEEITWDYSTTLFEDSWTMSCECGSSICRHLIVDFKHLPSPLQRRYRTLGILPPYLTLYLDSKADGVRS